MILWKIYLLAKKFKCNHLHPANRNLIRTWVGLGYFFVFKSSHEGFFFCHKSHNALLLKNYSIAFEFCSKWRLCRRKPLDNEGKRVRLSAEKATKKPLQGAVWRVSLRLNNILAEARCQEERGINSHAFIRKFLTLLSSTLVVVCLRFHMAFF